MIEWGQILNSLFGLRGINSYFFFVNDIGLLISLSEGNFNCKILYHTTCSLQ